MAIPAEKMQPTQGNDGASVKPAMKKRKIFSSPLLKTPFHVLNQIKQGEKLDRGRVLQALCNAVISSSVDDDGEEDPDALRLLEELLAQDGVDPDAGDPQLWDNYGGSPLFQACTLDLPEATKSLLSHGASVVQVYGEQTPLEVALGNKDSRCAKVIMDHIRELEKQVQHGRCKCPGPGHSSGCPYHH